MDVFCDTYPANELFKLRRRVNTNPSRLVRPGKKMRRDEMKYDEMSGGDWARGSSTQLPSQLQAPNARLKASIDRVNLLEQRAQDAARDP